MVPGGFETMKRELIAGTLLTFVACCVALAADPVQPLKRFGDAPIQRRDRAPFGGGFTLETNETVAFIGQANFVREQKSGELETLLALNFADRKSVV